MKDTIKINLTCRRSEASNDKVDLYVVGIYAKSARQNIHATTWDKRLNQQITRLLALGDFAGEALSHKLIYTHGNIPARRILLIGLGDKAKMSLNVIRNAAAIAANETVSLNLKTVAMTLHSGLPGKLNTIEVGRVIAEGVYYGSYRYDEYITKTDYKRPNLLRISLPEPDATAYRLLKKGCSLGSTLGRANAFARNIATKPGNVIFPQALADIAKGIAKQTRGLSCTVFDHKQLQACGMGGILSVGSGSSHPPRLIILKYIPSKTRAKQRPVIALVGKAVTFDSGGISIKPAANMDQMKFDKSGGVAVLATLQAIAELGIDLNVIGIIPSAENLLSGSSYRPGDIVTTYSGKTVEILNTDAEGRMILSDGIAYAVEKKCDIIIDIATLTGACMVALGHHKAGLMGNDDKLIAQLKTAADLSGENVWHLPSGEEYANEMKSKIADLKNTGSRWGGACTAAAFLHQFAGGARWAHLDIAGMDVLTNPGDPIGSVSTGFGVRLLSLFLYRLANES